ncbi:tetratricopeptide repeat protein [Baekduia sp. Peel2402]|uniref:tetratricopeptide repeat protein n=1 Tax=Baekduia sp. Peel2402 TaxID=3458296 RepID=UPI00403E471D
MLSIVDHLEDPERSFADAVALAEEDRVEDAVAAFDAVLARCADEEELQELAARTLDWKAYVSLEAGRHEEGLAVADALIARGGEWRSSVNGYRRRAHALARLDRREEGIAALREALVRFGDVEAEPVVEEVVRLKAALARDLIEAGLYDQALLVLDAYLAAEPEDVGDASWALAQQGLLLMEAGRVDEALEAYERLLDLLDGTESFGLRVRRAAALWNSTEAYGMTGRMDEAVETNERLAAEIAGDTPEVFAAMTAELDGRDDPRARSMRVGIQLKEAQVHVTLGRYEEAEALLRGVIERYGDDDLPDIRRMVAMAREQIGEGDVL